MASLDIALHVQRRGGGGVGVVVFVAGWDEAERDVDARPMRYHVMNIQLSLSVWPFCIGDSIDIV